MMLLLGFILFVLCKPAEGAQQEDTANATQPVAGSTWTEAHTGMIFRWVPAGCFLMGSPKGEPGRNQDEGPQHEVCLKGFWMGQTEVTVEQWRKVMKSDPSLIKNGDNYPVDMISWAMAKEYVRRLNHLTGDGFALPTEAQWEYACRAGTRTPYAFGDVLEHDEATFDKRFSLPAQQVKPRRKPRRKTTKPRVRSGMCTTAVASFPANAFGLYDMHGNVWEWCDDVYDPKYYAKSPHDTPRNAAEGPSRVLRGGSWVTKAQALRSANRSGAWPDLRTAFYGLRLVRNAPQPDAAAPLRPH